MPNKSVCVRLAAIEDADWIVGQLEQFAEALHTKLKIFPGAHLAKQKVLDLIENHIVLVAYKEDQLLGMIGGIVTPHFFNPEITTLAELFWWVDKSHRGSRSGLILLNAFVELGKLRADWVTMCLEKDSQIKDKCLLDRGFVPMERTYLLEVV